MEGRLLLNLRRLRAKKQLEQRQLLAAFICRTPNGDPITTPWLGAALNEPVHSFTLDYNTMNQGDQSHTAMLHVNGPCSCNTVFLKRIVTADMKERTLQKWSTDIASYQNEALFYKHIAPLLIQRSIKLPTPYYVHVDPPVKDGTIDGLRQARFVLLLEHFGEPYRQHSPLSKDEALTSLRFLAKLHGSCMEDASILAPARCVLFRAIETRPRNMYMKHGYETWT
jgi:hypothetical protein